DAAIPSNSKKRTVTIDFIFPPVVVKGPPAFTRPMQPALRRDKNTEAYPGAWQWFTTPMVVLNCEPLFYGHRPHFPSTSLATAITNGGTTAVPSLSPVHARSKIKTRLNPSCHLTRKLKLELVL
ncbi:MAG: hypothetical protein ABSA09_02895, partial [Desulfobaccales bacterium]